MERVANIRDFKLRIIVSTDLIARGVDLGEPASPQLTLLQPCLTSSGPAAALACLMSLQRVCHLLGLCRECQAGSWQRSAASLTASQVG